MAAQPLLFQRHQHMIDEALHSLENWTRLRLAEVLQLFQAKQRLTDLANPLVQAERSLRLPGQPPLNVVQHGVQGALQIAVKKVPGGHGMDHDLPGGLCFGPPFRRRACDERRPFHEGREPIVGPRNHPFREDDERPPRLLQDLHGGL